MAQDLDIVFYTQEGLTKDITMDTPNIEDVFVKADCQKGQCIIYGAVDYDSNDSDRQFQILQEGKGLVVLLFPPKSVRRVVTFGTDGASLYQHNMFGGYNLVVPDHNLDLTFVGGASSAIISGGSWELYTKPNYQGLNASKQAGKYPYPETLGFPNDKLMSIKKD